MAAKLLAGIKQRALNQGPTLGVRGIQVRDHHAHVRELARSAEHVGKGAGGNVGDGTGTSSARAQVLEVWRQLVQQDEGGLVGLEQAGPVGLIGGLGARNPEPLEGLALAQLVGDFTPQIVLRAVASVEGHHTGVREGVDVRNVSAILVPQVLVLGSQTSAHNQVSLTATHGLLEVEDRIGRLAGQPLNGPAQQVAHTGGDECLAVEGLAVAFVLNQLVKLFDLVADVDGQCVGGQLAGLLDGFHEVVFPVSVVGLWTPTTMLFFSQYSRMRCSTMLDAERCSLAAASRNKALAVGVIRRPSCSVLTSAMYEGE